MTNLNSVLIEGELVSEPVLSIDEPVKGRKECVFTLKSSRFTQEHVQEDVTVRIICRDRLAEVCGEYLRKGRCVRVVGRLVEPLAVHAEHVEFSPQSKEVRA